MFSIDHLGVNVLYTGYASEMLIISRYLPKLEIRFNFIVTVFKITLKKLYDYYYLGNKLIVESDRERF